MSQPTQPGLFPVVLPNGEPGTLFLRVQMEPIVESQPGVRAYVGPFADEGVVATVTDRIKARKKVVEVTVVGPDQVDPTHYYPVDDTFLNEPDIVRAMYQARDQCDAAKVSGDYEQWRDNPSAAREFLGREPLREW